MKDIRQQWKAHAASKLVTREDIAALCVYKILVQEKDNEALKAKLRKSFKPITNPTKLINGAISTQSLTESLRLVKYSSIVKWLEPEDIEKVVTYAQGALK